MKEQELRKHTTCSLCHQKIGHTHLPLFWTVRIQRHGLKIDALKRQMGLTLMLGGSAALAQALGPDEQMTTSLGTWSLTICEECACERHLPIAALAEADHDETSPEESEVSHG